MTKKISSLLFTLAPLLLFAQITISTQVPPAGLVSKDYLWNLILTNNSDGIVDLNIRINVQDPSSGEIFMSANSGSLSMGKGVKVITARDVMPVQYNYNVRDFSRDYLPVGTYIVCYQVYHGEDAFGEDCARINIDPLSPPLLNTPANKSSIETPYPQFTWMPPTAIDMFNDLGYDLLVTEVLEGQSPAEAIEYNAPVYSRTDLKQPTENYPTGSSALEDNKTYAWQVIARNGLNYAAKTEVWTFDFKKRSDPVDMVALTPFVKLRTSDPDKGIAPNGILKLAYNNKTSEKSVKVEILESSGQDDDKQPPIAFEVKLIQGENDIQYDLNKIMHPKENKVYLARLVNGLHETWFVQFVVKSYK